MDIYTYYINKKYSQLTQKSGCYKTESTLIVCLTDEKKCLNGVRYIYYCRFLCKLQKRHSLVLTLLYLTQNVLLLLMPITK